MIKLNLGCGNHLLEGFTNIDINNKKADLICNCIKLPFKKESIDRIETYHMIEHIHHLVFLSVIQHWYELLKVGGMLVIECPDIKKAMNLYLEGNKDMLYSIYGRQRYQYDTHFWGYDPQTLYSILSKIGFCAEIKPARDRHSLYEPCLRIEGEK